jgi:leader peptidase (prepilin peptidase)/N-methyltransferase
VAVWAVVGFRLGWSAALVPELALVTGLVPLALIDGATLTLPRRLVYPTGGAVAAGVVAAGAVSGSWHRALVAVGCAAVELVVFVVLHLVSPAGMGFGDVRLAPVIGGGLGWLGVGPAVAGALLAFVGAALWGVGLLVSGRGTPKTAVPFGVFLALGAVLAIVVT